MPDLPRYRPLEKGQIRLLRILPSSTPSRIQCSLSHTLMTESHYIALSYCWGTLEGKADVLIDGNMFAVTANLHSFLGAVVDGTVPVDAPLWIDAICINQRDVQEKSLQVQSMWQVYQSAAQVLSWIGEPRPLYEGAFNFINELGSEARRINAGSVGKLMESNELTKPDESVIDAIVSLTENEYFERMWIVQEMLNAKSVTLHSGPLSCSMTDLGILLSLLETMKGEGIEMPDVSASAQEVMWEYMLMQSTGHIPGADVNYAFSSAIGDTKNRECSDIRDKIYALYGLPSVRRLNLAAELPTDYSLRVEELYIRTLAYYETQFKKQGESPQAWVVRDSVQEIAYTLHVVPDSASFQDWLGPKVNSPNTIKLPSGGQIDCSGVIMQDLINAGPLTISEDPEFYHRTVAGELIQI